MVVDANIPIKMRLINVKTQQLEEFIPCNIPEYAIVCHSWGEEEF
jgi:hypothetical protein